MKKIAYWLLYGLIWLISLIPLRILYVLSDLIWVIMYLIPPLRYRHKLVRRNLEGSFPEMDASQIKAIERKFYRFFLDLIFESLKSASMPAWWIRRHMRWDGVELIDKGFREKRSMVMYLGHTGNWEWISSLPANVSADGICCQVYHPLENEPVDKVFHTLRSQYGAVSIALKHVVRTLLRYNKEGHQFIVGMIADQVPLWWDTHYWTNFLNRKTPVLSGGEQIARKMDLGIFYGHISRPRRGYYVLKVVPMFDHAQGLDDFAVTEKYFRLLEDNIKQSPQLWLWTHNRWKRDWNGYQEWLKTKLKSNSRDSEKE